MLIEIVKHTPLWVWAIPAFFIYRGLIASRDRPLSLRNIVILPIVLLCLSIQGMLSHYGLAPLPLSTWLGGIAIGALIGWQTVNASVLVDRNGTPMLRGSWVPLILSMAVFMTKYVTEVMINIRPDIMLETNAILAVCALYGLLNGIFIARFARTVTIYKRFTPQPATIGMSTTV